MTKFSFEYAPGATPLDPNEINGLIPNYITTQAELNQLEQNNIVEGKIWSTKKNNRDILSDGFIKKLHREMFKNVWKWAGTFRLSDKSIGVPWQNISVEVKKLCDDTEFWIANEIYPWEELGVRFHHRLVLIHPFPNGNGRHARLITDVLFLKYGNPPFTWGNGNGAVKLESNSDARLEYIQALREADQKKFKRLIQFVRS